MFQDWDNLLSRDASNNDYLSLALSSGNSVYGQAIDLHNAKLKSGWPMSATLADWFSETGRNWWLNILTTAITSSGTATVALTTGSALDASSHISTATTILSFTMTKSTAVGWVFQGPIPAASIKRYLQVKITASGGATAAGKIESWLGLMGETKISMKMA